MERLAQAAAGGQLAAPRGEAQTPALPLLAGAAGAPSSLLTRWPETGNMGSACSRFMPRWLRVSNACSAQRSILSTCRLTNPTYLLYMQQEQHDSRTLAKVVKWTIIADVQELASSQSPPHQQLHLLLPGGVQRCRQATDQRRQGLTNLEEARWWPCSRSAGVYSLK